MWDSSHEKLNRCPVDFNNELINLLNIYLFSISYKFTPVKGLGDIKGVSA